QPPPHTQQTVCVQTRGRQTLQELNPNPAPHTHNARKAPDQRNPHPHKPRGQEGAKNHTNPTVKKQPRAVEFSRNNRQPSTNPHGLFPGCGTNPNQDLTENPGSAPVRSLLYRLSSRPPNWCFRSFSDKARTESRRQFFAAQ